LLLNLLVCGGHRLLIDLCCERCNALVDARRNGDALLQFRGVNAASAANHFVAMSVGEVARSAEAKL